MTEYADPADAFCLLTQGASGLIVCEGFDNIHNHAIQAGRGTEPGNDGADFVPLA